LKITAVTNVLVRAVVGDDPRRHACPGLMGLALAQP
jgi:hypothetical protein